jgi:hypothetical protein
LTGADQLRNILFASLALCAVSIGVSAACLPIDQAPTHIGDTKCVSGKVTTVSPGPSGTTFLNFCEDQRQCPFTVVVFARDLREVGDVRQLAGTPIEIHGKITEYDGHPEIILSESRQLSGHAARLPPIPKAYDAERRGHYSAGKFKHPKQKRKRRGRKGRDSGTAGEQASDDSASVE